LNLSAVRKVSGQNKYTPVSGRDRDSVDLTTLSNTIHSDRRRGPVLGASINTKPTGRGSRVIGEKKLSSRNEDSGIRDDSNPSIINLKRKSEFSSSLISKLKK
jgi:hypothetical protein